MARTSTIMFLGAALMLVATSATSTDCYKSSILSPVPFMGNHDEIIKLADGSIWQVTYEYEYMYEYYPEVTVCPGRGKLIVGGKSLKVKRISEGKQASLPSAPVGGVSESAKMAVVRRVHVALSLLGRVSPDPMYANEDSLRFPIGLFRLQTGLPQSGDIDNVLLRELSKAIVEGDNFGSEMLDVAVALMVDASEWGHLGNANTLLDTSDYIESYIVSSFDGLEYGNIYKLANGQVWEQTEAWIWIWVWVNPKVTIWSESGVHKMSVQNIDHPVVVRQLK